jgi:hypothetical protein
MPNTTYLFTLKCGHIALAHSWRPDGTIDCRVEDRYNVPVIGVHLHEWHAKCLHPGCSWGRWTGLSQHVADNMAGRHIRTRMHKTVVLYEVNPAAQKKLQEMAEWINGMDTVK